ILPRPVTKPDLQMLKKTLNPCGIFGVKKGQSGDECAICIREPAMAVCLNNVSRPQTEPYLRLPRVALRP
ncbi:tail fiber domain protein, partial [Escherichia coli PA9]